MTMVVIKSVLPDGAATDALAQKIADHITDGTQKTQISGPVTVTGTVAISSLPAGAPISGTVAVSNLPATQPVSIASMPSTPVTGTFWQATQPVSIASMPSTPVTGPATDTQLRATPLPVSGTFFQATQPVSGPVTDAQLRASAVPVSLANAPTTPVTGTFWQATQPVSGAFFQATQPVSIASMPSTPVTGTFFQATQPVSAAALPLPTGAATDAALALQAKLTDTQPVSAASLPLPLNALQEAGGFAETLSTLLRDILRELKTQTFLLKEGLGIDAELDDIRSETEVLYADQ